MNDAVLVSRRWLERVNDRVFKTNAPPTPARTQSNFYNTRPVARYTAWAKDDDGIYRCKARFIVNDKIQQKDTIIFVYAPTVQNEKDLPTGRFFVSWRGRWEFMGISAVTIPTYGPGNYISIETTPTGSFSYVFHNAGCVGAKLYTDSSSTVAYQDKGVLLFGPFFKWDSSLVATVGKSVLCIEWHTENVVTDVTIDGEGNPQVTKKSVYVLGPKQS